MGEYQNMRLCGGTFFVLLLAARGRRRNSRMGNGRPSDGKNNPDVLCNLILSVNQNFQLPTGGSFNTFTTNYKKCKTSDSPSVGLKDKSLICQFDADIKKAYDKTLNSFADRLEQSINIEAKGRWLVAALIDLIEADDTISNDELFYVLPDGKAVKKTDLRNIGCICISSFVLGVWHYIIVHVQDNTVGADTINKLLEPATSPRAERKFNSDFGIGEKTASEIKTHVLPVKRECGNEATSADEHPASNTSSLAVASNVSTVGTLFDTYLKKAVEFYSKVKTLLYSEAPHNFNDLYVPNDIKLKDSITAHDKSKKLTPIEILTDNRCRYAIIRGTGGIGKSMMMRHLLLYSAEKYAETNLLPVLVPLKNFTNQVTNLETFIFDAIHIFDHVLTLEDFESVIKSGNCLILLDGLDEIPGNSRQKFDTILVQFVKAYPENSIVLSSRPTSNFIQFMHFQVLDIVPFSKEKALELIDKLEYHDPEAKARFRLALEKELYYSHREFASNPLLLTIMLMTFTAYGEVPDKSHVFYAKAYETMARLHDATKGAYVRPMHTGLSPEDFATYFSEFCARTYRDDVLEFDEHSFSDYMKAVIGHKNSSLDATPRDFLLDLTDNLCILYKEGEKYYFIHRSFQEYFSAVFFSNQMDDKLEYIGSFFEEYGQRIYADRTFDMLFDMIPDRINRYIFLPFLKKLWKTCDSKNGYWTFLEEIYPIIYVGKGQTGDYQENEPLSYLYDFIVNECLLRRDSDLYDAKWPPIIDRCNRKEWVFVESHKYTRDKKQYSTVELVTLDKIRDEYVAINAEPTIVGVSWEIKINEILSFRDFYGELISFMEDDKFPLKREYRDMRRLTERYEKSINNKPSSDDWFDYF